MQRGWGAKQPNVGTLAPSPGVLEKGSLVIEETDQTCERSISLQIPTQYFVKPSEGSKAGLNNVSAGGSQLANIGEKHVASHQRAAGTEDDVSGASWSKATRSFVAMWSEYTE